MNTKGSRAIPNKQKKKMEFIEAIKSNYGLLTPACSTADIAFQTYRNWYHADEEFKEQVDKALEQAHERTNDLAEGKLFEAIHNGDMTGTIFYLKTKGKKRGYIERQEITGKDGESLFDKESVQKIAKELAD
jgi:hypothetical protein